MGNLAERLKKAMLLRRLEVADLVEKTGLSKAAIHFVLGGTTRAETIRAFTVDKLAEALSVNREWLLYGRGTPDTILGRSSQSVGLDEATLLNADYWVQFEQTASGVTQITPEIRNTYLRRLAEVYALAQADGGRLSDAHADQIINAVKGDRNVRSTKDRGGNGA